MNFKKYLLLISSITLLISCGDPVVNISDVDYKIKIAVEGYLYPGKNVENIKLMRNFELNTIINPLDLLLIPEKGYVKAEINGHELTFNPSNGMYYTNDFIPDYNSAYTLKVEADIEGKRYFTESTTTTPRNGFAVIENNLGTITYREKDPEFNFNISPGTGFYLFSIRANDASMESFIYDNPYLPNLTEEDLKENFNQFLYQSDVILNLNTATDEVINYKIKGLDTWFYSNYTIIVYAGDTNFKDYIITANNVQEPDGNFIEPRFHFEGSGIGIFGSAIRDTLVFNLIK